MAPIYRLARKGDLKRTIKFLAVCKDPRIQRMVLASSSDSVYKSICNAFLNVAQNPDINLSPPERKRLAHHNPLIEKLISRRLSLKRKRLLIQQRGSGGGAFLLAILPTVLSTALSFLGSSLFSKPDNQGRQSSSSSS